MPYVGTGCNISGAINGSDPKLSIPPPTPTSSTQEISSPSLPLLTTVTPTSSTAKKSIETPWEIKDPKKGARRETLLLNKLKVTKVRSGNHQGSKVLLVHNVSDTDCKRILIKVYDYRNYPCPSKPPKDKKSKHRNPLKPDVSQAWTDALREAAVSAKLRSFTHSETGQDYLCAWPRVKGLIGVQVRCSVHELNTYKTYINTFEECR